MKTVKIVSIFASTIIFLLIALTLNLEDPLKANYRHTIDKMMALEITSTENEILEKYPALSEAKEKIAKADRLKMQICSKTSGLAPTLKKAEEIELEKMQSALLASRQNAERLLKNMQSNNAIAIYL